MEIASDFNLAVILMNQVTTKFMKNEARLTPALGESWSHAASCRVMLEWKVLKLSLSHLRPLSIQDGVRRATIIKSSNRQSANALFTITPDGVRDYQIEKMDE